MRHYLALGFGTIVGVGWVVYVGNWLDRAGPIGASLAFALGTVLILPIGFCYATISVRLPVAGGEMAYAYHVFGSAASYAVGWILSLCYVSITVFEAVAFGAVCDELLPGLQGPILHSFGGHALTTSALLYGVVGTVAVAWANLAGIAPSASSQLIVEWAFVGVSALFIVSGFAAGSPENLRPLVPSEGFPAGFAAVLLTVPVFLAGFNVIPQLMEERADRANLTKVGQSIIWSIVAAATFYILVILSVAYVSPWTGLVSESLPAATAFEHAFGSPFFGRIVLLAAVLGVLTTWNGLYLATSRILFAMGRAGFIPRLFSKVHEGRRIPHVAILVIAGLSLLGTVLGQGVLLPVVNISSAIFGLAFLLTAVGVHRLRRLEGPGRILIFGGNPMVWAGILAASVFTLLAFYEPYRTSNERLPIEYPVFLAWAVLGLLFWFGARRRRGRLTEDERRLLIMGEA